jgi:hypothetical protein
LRSGVGSVRALLPAGPRRQNLTGADGRAVDHDVIGGEPERAPRRRRVGRGVQVPDPLRRHRRTVLAIAAVVAVVAAVVVLRAGLGGLRPATGPGAPPTRPPGKPPLAGSVLALAAGQNTVYALASDCSAGCRPMLLASTTDGGSWQPLRLPELPSDPSAVATWRLAVTGVEDSLSVEDGESGTVLVGSTVNPFVARRITAGPPVARVPAGQEPMVRICAAPRCRTPRLSYLDPRTGVIGPLANQPPLRARALAVLGGQLWAAGIDPGTGRYAMAVTMDDAASWALVPLPQVSTDPKLVPRIAPVPELDTAWLLLGRPGRRGQVSSEELWVVPAPDTGAPPHRVRPEDTIRTVAGAVGVRDGRLALVDGGQLTVLAPDGVVDRMATADADSTGYLLRQPQRGPRLLLVALAVRTDGVAAIATSSTGDANDWKVRPVVL